MPELPEVETVMRGLAPHLEGRKVTAARSSRLLRALPSARRLTHGLVRRRVTRLWRRGKYMLIDLDDGRALLVHLGMSGRLVLEPLRSKPDKHLHLAVRLAGLRAELRFYDPRRFGRVALGGIDELAEWTGLGALGIEPLEAAPADIAAALRGRPKRLKALLLEGGAVAGLGNIYADEALFRARVHPERVASTLGGEQALCLGHEIRAVLEEAISSGGSTIGDYVKHDGEAGSFQESHLVYGREGEKCPRCGRKIVRREIAGRGTHFCPNCQRVPRERRASPRRLAKRLPGV